LCLELLKLHITDLVKRKRKVKLLHIAIIIKIWGTKLQTGSQCVCELNYESENGMKNLAAA
jgi:hypothetical protein